MQTTVVSVRGQDRETLLADPDFVYVGRSVWRTKWERSTWGNPYRIKKGHPATNEVERYRRRLEMYLAVDLSRGENQYIDDKKATRLHLALAYMYQTELPKLKGKKLGCWCGNWKPGEPPIGCHAVVLAQLADAWNPRCNEPTSPRPSAEEHAR